MGTREDVKAVPLSAQALAGLAGVIAVPTPYLHALHSLHRDGVRATLETLTGSPNGR